MKILSRTPEITFDDVLILPNKTDFSIEEESLNIDLQTRVSRNIQIKIPIVSAPMPGVTESKMAITLGKLGGMGFIHHFQSFERQLLQVQEVKRAGVKVAACISDFTEKGYAHIENLLKLKTDIISIETASAHNKPTIDFLKKVKKKYQKAEISVALVVTQNATEELIKAGADSIRVGIGGGSHCTTRLVTGVGRPQLSAVQACYSIAKKYNIPIISDTGIKYSGDVVKALVFGGDTVMLGGILSGTEECPGSIIIKAGKKYKYSWGMCTNTAIQHQQLNRLSQNLEIIKKIKNYLRSLILISQTKENMHFFEEGIEKLIPYKGSVIPIITQIISGIKRSMWYQGSINIKDLRNNAKVVLVSNNTYYENLPRI